MNKPIPWSSDEIEILTKYCLSHKTLQELLELFPNRTIPSIKHQIKKLNLTKSRNYWTAEEIQLLKDNYSAAESFEDLLKLFPGRTYRAIKRKATIYKLSRKNYWTKKEIKILKQYYPSDINSEDLLKLLPGRSHEAIIFYAYKLKLKRPEVWLEDDINRLKQYYPADITNEELLKLFPGKTYSSLVHKASRLGIRRAKRKPAPKEIKNRRWTEDELDLVKKFYYSMTREELLRLLPNRTESGLKQLIRKLGFPRKPIEGNPYTKCPPWTDREIKTLIKYYDNKPNEELQQLIPGRSLSAINMRAYLLGIKRGRFTWASKGWCRPWKEEELEILKANLDKTATEVRLLLPYKTIGGIQKKVKSIFGVSIKKK
ncbi:MAG: hypothetical protein PHC34_04130 [Candidatus Gastranaerophilales bacterium]|nr:hypothetical protein [Candidatus Gastranaerophilales bacterium]